MLYLFIGGHNNGKRIELPGNPPPTVCVPVFPSEPAKYDAPPEYFQAMPFVAEGGRFIIYALHGMSPYQALQALIDSYPDQTGPKILTHSFPPLLPLGQTEMVLCPKCGNKRCPHASDHSLECTGSNVPGQPGSIYA